MLLVSDENIYLLSPLLHVTWEQSAPAALASPESASPGDGSWPLSPAPAEEEPALLFVLVFPPAPPEGPDPVPASPEPPAAPAPLSASAAPVEVVRVPPLQVRRHWPLEQEELTEEHEPEHRSSPPHETRHRPLLQEVDRPENGVNCS